MAVNKARCEYVDDFPQALVFSIGCTWKTTWKSCVRFVGKEKYGGR